MMEGIEVLSQTLVEGYSPFAYATIGLCVMFAITLVVAIAFAIQDECVFPVLVTVVAFLVFVIPTAVLGFGLEVCKEPDKMHYKVTISDDVSFAEFYEKYEIIDREGQIYEIVERDEEVKD